MPQDLGELQIIIGGVRLYFPRLTKQSPLLTSRLCSLPFTTPLFFLPPFTAAMLSEGGDCRQCVQFSLKFSAQSIQSFHPQHRTAHVLVCELTCQIRWYFLTSQQSFREVTFPSFLKHFSFDFGDASSYVFFHLSLFQYPQLALPHLFSY